MHRLSELIMYKNSLETGDNNLIVSILTKGYFFVNENYNFVINFVIVVNYTRKYLFMKRLFSS